MRATYLTAPREKKAKRNPIFAMISLFLSFVVLLSGGFLATTYSSQEAKADGGPVNWVVCWFGEDSYPATLYSYTYTDALAYMLYSKSAIVGGTDDVRGGSNLLLLLTLNGGVDSNGVSGIEKTNETILGYSLDGGTAGNGSFNAGEKTSVFDRFGFQGLDWSTYGGEWLYQKVDVCGDSESTGTTGNEYYSGRLYPKSTWDEVGDSLDVRAQVASNKASVYLDSWFNNVANILFSITKTIVALTVALIGFAFTDLVSLLNLNDLLAGDTGIFPRLFNGLYMPLLVIMMVIAGCWLFYQAVVKKQYRKGFGGLLRSLFMIVVAIVISLNPTFWLALPNDVAIMGQALLVNATSGSITANDDGLCTVGGTYSLTTDTDSAGNTVQKYKLNTDTSDVTDTDDDRSLLEKAANSIQSVVGCQLWYNYAFTPWVLGQFGTTYDQLYADDGTGTTYVAGGTTVKNSNGAWVGDAAVPLGGGFVVHNWAIFQLSTQTNAHSAYGADGQRAVYVNGVAADWYRVVDAMSNYNEKQQENAVPTSNSGTGTTYKSEDAQSFSTTLPDTDEKPLSYWSTWIGQTSLNRISIAFGSIIPALIGNLAPLLFAGMACVYTLALSVALAFSPFFLILGTWPGRGWEMFKGWGQQVLNLVVKRIILGLLLIVSLVVITELLNIATTQNYWWGVALMMLASVLFIKFRNKIFEFLAGILSFNFASGGMGDHSMAAFNKVGSKLGQATRKTAKLGRDIAGSGTYGAIKAKQAGLSARQGFMAGMREELKQTAQKSRTWNRISQQTQNFVGRNDEDMDSLVADNEVCVYCGVALKKDGDEYFNGGYLPGQGWVCEDCMNGANAEVHPLQDGAYRRPATFQSAKDIKERNKGNLLKDYQPSANGRSEGPSQGKTSALDALKIENLKEDENGLFHDENGNVISDLADFMGEKFLADLDNRKFKNVIPAIPSYLQPYMTANSLSGIPLLWEDGSPAAIQTLSLIYATAYVDYARDNDLIPMTEDGASEKETRENNISWVYATMANSIPELSEEDIEEEDQL